MANKHCPLSPPPPPAVTRRLQIEMNGREKVLYIGQRGAIFVAREGFQGGGFIFGIRRAH